MSRRRRNEKDLSEIPAEIRKELTVKLVDTMDEVLPIALMKPIEPRKKKAKNSVTPKRKLPKKEIVLPQ